ncbi:hypothetical protein HK100_004245 [Physocladia obscura]|uniref:Uncharacterized protein n=1 Tax=Physocladia obscura TaxID=109957 RepID=A0AAD5SVB0_9FUNG|nr:hypothetical protein HK100_004245 [Physocladia obscura]
MPANVFDKKLEKKQISYDMFAAQLLIENGNVTMSFESTEIHHWKKIEKITSDVDSELSKNVVKNNGQIETSTKQELTNSTQHELSAKQKRTKLAHQSSGQKDDQIHNRVESLQIALVEMAETNYDLERQVDSTNSQLNISQSKIEDLAKLNDSNLLIKTLEGELMDLRDKHSTGVIERKGPIFK